jgi:hypothetical protein
MTGQTPQAALKLPEPVGKKVSDLPDTERAPFGLDLRPWQSGWRV